MWVSTRKVTKNRSAGHRSDCRCGAHRVVKATPDEVDAIVERALSEAMVQAITQLRQSVSGIRLEETVRASVVRAMQALDQVLEEADFSALVDTMTRQVIAAGTADAATLGGAKGLRPTVGFSFDRSDPRAILWARERAGMLIRQIGDEVRTKVADTIVRLLDGQLSQRQAAAEIARNVGLHDRWQKAVDNSYDETYQSLLDAGLDPYDAAEQAAEAADKYAQSLIKTRANNIARTELATAQNQGRYLLWQQAADQGLINTAAALKEWRTAPEFVSSGTEVCPICEPMNGVRTPVFTDFVEVGVAMPPAHPNCRCRAVLIVQPIEEVRQDIAEMTGEGEADIATEG